MHTVLLTLVALGVGPGDNTAQKIGPSAKGHGVHAGCEFCGDVGHGHASRRDIHKSPKAQHNMMPQSCYDPTFGCYRGSRFMNRYPAFHGTYYRRPYNYRNLFEYPWHAEPHEPTSLFSSAVGIEPTEGDPPAPPQPQPNARSSRRAPSNARRIEPNDGSIFDLSPIGTGLRGASRDQEESEEQSSRNASRVRSVSTPRLRR